MYNIQLKNLEDHKIYKSSCNMNLFTFLLHCMVSNVSYLDRLTLFQHVIKYFLHKKLQQYIQSGIGILRYRVKFTNNDWYAQNSQIYK